MVGEPAFRRVRSGALAMNYTEEARKVARANKKRSPPLCLNGSVVTCHAVDEVRRQFGDDIAEDSLLVLGHHRLQFGAFHGQTFQWMLENGMGYAAWFVADLRGEKETDTPLSINKFTFKRYVLSFKEGREAVAMKERERAAKQPSPTPPNRRRRAKAKDNTHSDDSDAELVAAVDDFESGEGDTQVLLPDGWKQSLPDADHQWISKALFKVSKKSKAELAWERVDRLWWHPPQPALNPSQLPHPDRYFSQRLLLWMPRKLWQVRLACPNSSCSGHQLTSAGIYPRVRQVLDLDGYYHLAAEYLECGKCKKKLISWSGAIVRQLDLGHRLQFPVLLTYRFACDIRVARLLRQRGLGNSASQLRLKLVEQHGEKWSQRIVHYLTDCQTFTDATARNLMSQPDIHEPPQMASIPGYKWLQTVYCNDVIMRLDEVKASITSVFGRVLKLDSTKKVVKKLAGHSAGTASWATNVGNEYGQVLMSVLTASEGFGLGPMVSGIVRRYRDANVNPPQLLYVDRDCCGKNSALRNMFGDWPELKIRLDIWHFMRRFAIGCTTDSHQLHRFFMSRLSACIFEWSEKDVSRLKEAKRAELGLPRDTAVSTRITRNEIALHCRRKTRGVEETTTLIKQLLDTLSGEQGLDTLGVPLLDSDRIWDIWESQKRHIACIQDPEDFSLYTETGQVKKGGVLLPVFRCARGSTSLESFHLHLNRFIPGTSASGMHFQAYLLEGLVRWNEDRAVAAVKADDSSSATIPHSYSGLLKHVTNRLSSAVLGRPLHPSYKEPFKYTGELIGIEYLYSQTGEVLQDYTLDPDSEESAHLDAASDDEEDEGYEEESSPDEDLTLSEDPCNESTDFIRESNVKRQLFTGERSASLGAPPQSSPSNSNVSPPDRPASPSAASTSSSPTEAEDAVDLNNVPGLGKVEALADCLFSLRHHSQPLTNQQADRIVKLWSQLDRFDHRTKFSPRYRTRKLTGRFKASKSTVAPGVESTKRCFVGQNSGPAQWPDCNRYVECLISKLCDDYPAPVRKNNTTVQRWTLICRAYKNIRQKVLNNARVMQGTTMQLVEINQTTLIQWHNKKSKKQELQILEQGISLEPPAPCASLPLPPPMQKPPSMPVPPSSVPVPPSSVPVPPSSVPVPQQQQQLFLFTVPANTSGQAVCRQPPVTLVLPAAGQMHQPANTQAVTLLVPAGQMYQPATILLPSGQTDQPSPVIPRSTKWYQKKKREREQAGHVCKKYARTKEKMSCRQCGKERDNGTHRQYYGNWFCQETSDRTYEEWRNQFAQKNYGKKK